MTRISGLLDANAIADLFSGYNTRSKGNIFFLSVIPLVTVVNNVLVGLILSDDVILLVLSAIFAAVLLLVLPLMFAENVIFAAPKIDLHQ